MEKNENSKGITADAHTNSMLAVLLVKYIFNYLKYVFLVPTIILPLGIFTMMALLIDPHVSFDWLRHFAFIDSKYQAESFSMDINDIMKIFFVLSLFLMVLVGLIKIIINKIWQTDLQLSLKSKAKLVYFCLFIVYGINTAVSYSKGLESKFYFIFVFFFAINVFSATAYLVFDLITRKIDASLKQAHR